MTRYQQVEQYIQQDHLIKLVSDSEIKAWVRAWRGEFDARELVRGLIESQYITGVQQ